MQSSMIIFKHCFKLLLCFCNSNEYCVFIARMKSKSMEKGTNRMMENNRNVNYRKIQTLGSIHNFKMVILLKDAETNQWDAFIKRKR